MSEELSLKVKLETQVKELEKQKESLSAQGAFKDAPKRLQQIEIWIKELKNLIDSLDPKSTSQLNSTRSLFSKIINDLIQFGLKLKDISKELQDLYKKRNELDSSRESRRTTLDTQRSRLDKSGNLRGDDPEARRWLAKANITYANKKTAMNVETLRTNTDKAEKNGWQGVFASEKDFKEAQKMMEKVTAEENMLKESIRQLKTEIDDLTSKIRNLDEEIGKRESSSEIPAEVSNLTDIKSTVSSDIGKQKETNVQDEIEENTIKNTEAANDYTAAINKQSNSLGKAFKQFTIYAMALRTIKKALHEAVGTIKNLDKYLTEQAMVTGKTRKETYQLLTQYQQMAASLGATTKEVAEVATQFMRQGKSTADALTLTNAAISAAKVAGISAAESVNYLTTALNGFQLSAQQAMDVSDKFAAIAAQSATSYEEIATALSKVAAQANLAGMSIDYTTAILAKGIETTREAPETIGTALKTIIARMRELGDYGETLEDGMDINNVETQLAYVDIKLRDTNGELRSTEDVLDELGKKWDTLSSNQQAAVAKALAGTRQQSRLIAMMNDYERVTELQEIAQRSSGATAAQAEVYMEGMEAALNRLSVTWEKIVTTVTDSDVIIGLIEKVTNLLEFVNDLLSNEFVLTSSLVLLFSTLILSFIKRYEMQKAHNRALLQQEKTERDKVIAQKLEYAQALKNFIAAAKSGKSERAKLKTLYEQNKALAEQRGDMASAAKYAGLIARLGTEDALNAQEVADARNELALTESEITGLRIQQTQTDLQMVQNGKGLVSILGNALAILTPILTIMSLINMVQQAINAKKLRSIALTKKETAAESKGLLPKVSGMFAKVVSAFSSAGIPGVIAGIALATALAAALGVGIAAAMGAFNQPSAQDAAADKVNKLSNEIYKLTEKANALKAIEDQFDALDKKIIKTTDDTKAMSEALNGASDKLDSTRKKDDKDEEIAGTSDKEVYESLVDDVSRREYLARKEEEYRVKANNKRKEQIATLAALTETEREAILTSKDNAKYLQTQSAVRAINNNTLYEYIDGLENAGEKTEQLTQAILDELSALEAYDYAAGKGGKSVAELAEAIDSAKTTIDGVEVRWSDILESDDYDFNQRIEAFKALKQAVADLNDDTLLNAFNEAFQQWSYLDETMSESTRTFMSQVGMTMDRLNDWGLVLQKFGMSTEEAASRIDQVLTKVSNGMHIGSAIRDVFEKELSQFKEGTDEWVAAYNKLLNAYQSAMNVSILNIGQNMEALHNRVNNIYEQASKWNELSDTEKTTFMNDNADLFSGEDGKRLYEAFKTQNYALIQQELEHNEALNKTIEKRKQELQILLDIEEARDEKDRNEGQIEYLKEQIKLLNETKNIYRASLKLRLDQENAQLDIYKEYLKKQQSALEDSLNKRKEAYEKYFETINKEAEDEEYEEQANLLITNLSKLAASGDAGSKLQSAELEAQLKELEKERLAELRERAQEAVIQNIDDQLTEISEKFDELLENNQLLLQAMTAQITGDPTGFVSRILASETQGLTALGAESVIEEFRTTFGSILPSEALDNITVNESTTGDTLILNVAGKEIEIGDSTQQELYLAIMKAMRQLGIK